MDAASEAQDFERAALYRDRLTAVRSLMERQRVAGGSVGTADLIGVAVEGATPTPRSSRSATGCSPSARASISRAATTATGAEVAESFLLQYYGAAPAVPPLVVVGPELRERSAVLAEALAAGRDAAVEVRAAERGDMRRLRELAERNAKLALAQDQLRREHRRQRRVEALSALQEALGMEELPMRIEGFDISNLGETHTVASMVVFEGGAPKKSDYRRFKIRESTQDDFAAMNEVLTRRANRLGEQQADLSPHDAERDESFASLPDLVVIDGGKGQLSAGMKALEPLTERGVTVISLAKRIEEVFVPGRIGAAAARRGLGGAAAAAAGPRRGAPVRDRAPPRPPRPGDDRLGARRRSPASARPASGRCCATSARRSACSPPAARSSKRCPACLAK